MNSQPAKEEGPETLAPTGKLASVGMGNVLEKAKQEQVIALGLGVEAAWLVAVADRAGNDKSLYRTHAP